MLLKQGALVILAYYVTCVTATLELVHVVFRHGQRTPADTFPTDPNVLLSLEPVGWGQLTNKGKLDQFNQGRFLRKRYNEFLGDLYSPKAVYVQSTDVDRTKMSAQLEMAGLYPPAPAQKWRSCLKWQPIPIHSQPLSQDDLLLMRIPCLRYTEELERVMALPEVDAALTAMDADTLYSELTILTGMPITSPDDIQSLYSTLKAEEGYNMTLAAWTREYYPDKLEPLTAYSYQLNSYNSQLQKLKGGRLLEKIVTDSQLKLSGEASSAGRKLFVYAGHDSTVTNLLMALKVWNGQIPDYDIMVIAEIHSSIIESGDPAVVASPQISVKLFLRNSTTAEPYPLTIPGCAHDCPVDTMAIILQDVYTMNLDLTEACKPLDPNYVPLGTELPGP